MDDFVFGATMSADVRGRLCYVADGDRADGPKVLGLVERLAKRIDPSDR